MPEMKSTEANAAHLHAETMTPLHSLPFATSADPRDLHAAQHTRPQSGTATAVARTVRHVWTHHAWDVRYARRARHRRDVHAAGYAHRDPC